MAPRSPFWQNASIQRSRSTKRNLNENRSSITDVSGGQRKRAAAGNCCYEKEYDCPGVPEGEILVETNSTTT